MSPAERTPELREPQARRNGSLLLIDNYDSFTHNLAHAFAVLGPQIEIVPSDRITIEEIRRRAPDYLVLSAGPRGPREAGISLRVVSELGGVFPLLGVCLGHQCIGEAFGASAQRAALPVHGKTSEILHDGRGLFAGIPSGFRAARYHSLIVPHAPEQLEVLARTCAGEIMAIGHVREPIWGVQFHPESFLTEHGGQLLENFLDWRSWSGAGEGGSAVRARLRGDQRAEA
ncbi:MAG: aminodeoxychorismate/anthranilate synthase component II [Deltaproteobacteria bacterium]